MFEACLTTDDPSGALSVRPFLPPDLEPLIELWRSCDLLRPWNDPASDIARCVNHDRSTVLVGELDGKIVASAMVGYDGHRGWVYYLGVDPTKRRAGMATLMLQHAERWLEQVGAVKAMLMVRTTNLPVVQFYQAQGYRAAQVVTMEKWLSAAPEGH